MKATAAEPPPIGGSGEEATKYIFRFKVDLGGKKRRRGGDGPQGVGPPASSSAPSSSSSSPTTSSLPTPAPPGGIEQYLSKTRIKLLRDKQVEERKQQQAQLQSILKQHEDQLVQRQPPPPSSSSSSSVAATPTTDRVQPSDGSSSPGDRRAPTKPEASGGGGGGGFDVAAFLSEANAGTVHPLGAGLFHKKRARGGSNSSGSTPPSRSTGKQEAKRSSGEEEGEDYDDNDDDDDDENGVDEEAHAVQPQPQRKTVKNESDGSAPKSGGKNKNKGGVGAGWRRDAEAAATAAAEEEMRRSVNEVVKPIGGRRLATTAQFFPHTPPPGLGGGLSSPVSSCSSLSPETAPSLVALTHTPHMTAAHASRDSFTVVRQRKPPRADAPSAAAAGNGEAQQAAVRGVVPLRQGGHHLSFVYEGLTLVNMYETYIWNYTPMHPSILHESSVRRILCGSEEDAGTPLALGVNVALAAASYWLGNAKRGNEFYRVARHHLAYLFDSSSYEVAEALITLGVLSFGQGDVKRFGYFVHLASTICRRIGAYNSDIYAKCVIATALDPLCPHEDKTSLLADYNRKARPLFFARACAPVSPYYDSTRAIFPEHSGDVVFNERSRMLYKRYIKIRDADRHLSIFWLTLREWEQAAKALEQHTCTKPLPQAYMDEASITRFLRALLHLEAMLEADYLGDGFHVTMVLYRLAARAKYHLMRGDEAKSWFWVSQSVESLQNVHTVRISPTTLPAYQTLLDVLLHFKRTDLVRSVAKAARGWIDIHPVCRSAVDHYLQLAEAAAATLPPALRPTPAEPTTISTTSRRCDAYPGVGAGAGAVRVTAPRDYHQAPVGHFPSDRFVSVTRTRHQQRLSAGLPATSGPPPTATATAPAMTATTSSIVAGRAWGEPGRESGQDIPHGQVIPLEASGRESWSGVGTSPEANSDLPVLPPTAAAAVMGQQHRPVEDFDSGCLVGGQRKDNGRSSFDWSLFLQDLEANNT